MRIEEVTFQKFQRLIYERTGIALEADKQTLLEGRLRREMKSLGQGDFCSYYEFISAASERSEAYKRFIDVVTTHDTSFFRCTSLWQYLETHLAERLDDKQNRFRPFRAWSGAVSTGEEAYTLAMIMHRGLSAPGGYSPEILATDISEGSIQTAKQGRYDEYSVSRMKGSFESYFNEYISPDTEGVFRVSDVLRDFIKFEARNAFDALHREEFDLVLFRNVLMYFKEPEQRALLDIMRRAVRKGGLVIIGETETIRHWYKELEYVRPGVYLRHD